MSTKRINDEFTNLPISRQRKYQLRKQAQGLCSICGRRKAVHTSLCASCMKRRGIERPGKNKVQQK